MNSTAQAPGGMDKRTRLPLLFAFSLCLLFSTALRAADQSPTPLHLEWALDNTKREATLYLPSTAKDSPTPLLFVFHGHGGTSANASRSMPFHTLWPEAIVVYPQGLNTPGRLTDKEGKAPGWQAAPGEQSDRDLKFVDAVLASLKRDYKIDEARIYATGHSNGGTMTYVLWSARPEIFAAFAPSATALSMFSPALDLSAAENHLQQPLRPLLHIAGQKDPLVKFQWQQATFDRLRKLYKASAPTHPTSDENFTVYASTDPATPPLATYIHPGAHTYPKGIQPLVVQFFKDHPR